MVRTLDKIFVTAPCWEAEDGTMVMTERHFKGLPEYSCTLPTGTTIGKVWRRREPYQTGPGIVNEWYLGEYVEDPDPKLVGIRWRKILIVPEFPDVPWTGYP